MFKSFIFTAALLFCANAFADYGRSHGRGQVCLFEHAGFMGHRVCLADGQQIRNLDQYGLNDRVSSIQIYGSASVTLCEHAGFEGACRTYRRDVENLQYDGFNDVASSVNMRPRYEYGVACFYEHAGFQGRRLCLRPGEVVYNLDSYGFNDVISSITLNGRTSALVCVDADFGRSCRVVRSNESNLGSWNDKISSIEVSY